MKRKYTLIWYDEVDSTNSEAQRRLSELDNLSVTVTRNQVAGRGQRGNSWNAAAGENLTFSIVLKFGEQPVPNVSEGVPSASEAGAACNPAPCCADSSSGAGTAVPAHRRRPDVFPIISAKRQFFLSEAVSLGVAEYLSEEHVLPSKIKWPNDIYVGDAKIGGILIENSLHGNNISACIIGIGLNVNQRDFPADIPNPTSMTILTGRTFNIEEELGKLLQHIDRRIGKVFGAKARSRLTTDYLRRLYRWNEPHDYLIIHPSQFGGTSVRTGDNSQCPLDDTPQRFTGAIRGVTPHGQLIIEDIDTFRYHQFAFKEVEFII